MPHWEGDNWSADGEDYERALPPNSEEIVFHDKTLVFFLVFPDFCPL